MKLTAPSSWSAALCAPKSWSAALCAALGLGLLLRLLALPSAFWFDEILSASHALQASSLGDLYARTVDNNHLLNSLFLYGIGPREGWIAYRGLAFASGLVLLLLVAFEPGRTPAERILRALLLSASPLLVLLSTEARGYAPALAAAFAAWLALRARLRSGGVGALVAFELLLPLGLLSHLAFIHVYVASFAYAVVVLRSRATVSVGVVRELALLFALPGALAIAHVVLFAANMEIVGGPAYGAIEFARRVVAFGFGVPEWSALCLTLAGLGTVLFGAQLRSLQRRGDPRWVFDAVVVVVSPLIVQLAFAPEVMAVRYFSLPILFFTVAAADRLAAWLAEPGARRIAAAGVLATILAGNAAHHVEFARTGRGQYLEALRDMAATQPGSAEMTIAGDHDSRVGLLVRFYARYLDRPARYVGRGDARNHAPAWFIDHEVHDGGPPPERISALGHSFVLFGRYDFAGLSGFRWNVYRLDVPAAADHPPAGGPK